MRRYTLSKVRSSGCALLEEPRDTPRPRSGQRPRVPGCDGAGTAKRSYPTSKARGSGWEEQPHPKARGGGREEQPHVQGAVAAWAPEGLQELVHVQVGRGGSEEISLAQGKEQQLRFAGAAVKRYPMPKVRETQVRQ